MPRTHAAYVSDKKSQRRHIAISNRKAVKLNILLQKFRQGQLVYKASSGGGKVACQGECVCACVSVGGWGERGRQASSYTIDAQTVRLAGH